MSEPMVAGLVLLAALFAFLAAGVWVAVALLAGGVLALALFTSAPVGQALATTVWGASNSWALAALPMFIWMGEILFRTRLAEDMFRGLAPWLTRLPGRLLHVNILGCAIFAAVSGSSAATAATIGRMNIPELRKRGYDERMVIATLAGSGTLGLLIPPSIILIVYGVATDQSIARLFIAGVLPGLLLVALFMGYVIVWALLHPRKVPAEQGHSGWGERLAALQFLAPVLGLIAAIIGSIYAGLASPTEAAALGVVFSLLLAWLSGSLNRQTFTAALMGAMRTSAMIAFILAGAAFLTVAMGFTGIPRALAAWIGEMQLSPLALIAALTVFFIVMGMFLDGISVVVLTTSVIIPMIEQAGFDLIWFGIYLVLVVEMAQITPPVGFNLFVLQGLTGRDIFHIARAALPFFLLMCVAVAIIVAFPEIATWLPRRMSGG